MADERAQMAGAPPYGSDAGHDRQRAEELESSLLYSSDGDTAAPYDLSVQHRATDRARRREFSLFDVTDGAESAGNTAALITRRSPTARVSPYPVRNPRRISASPNCLPGSSSDRRAPLPASPHDSRSPAQPHHLRCPHASPHTSRSPASPPVVDRQAPLPTSPHNTRSQASPTAAEVSTAATAATEQARYRLLVQPIVKTSVSQRDISGKAKNEFAASGNSFDEIIHVLWDQFHSYIKCKAVKADGDSWSAETPELATWSNVMQFKANNHLVKSLKMSREDWHKWLVNMRKKKVEVLLYIYEYGSAVVKAQDLVEFKETCLQPEQTDRSGAAAESELREMAGKLQTHWQDTFRADAVVWRMWANHVIRNLNCSTWDSTITQLPPSYIMNFIRPAESHFEAHISNLSRSSSVTLDCVSGCMADFQQLRQDWEAFGRRLEECERHMQVQKSTLEAFIRDLAPPSLEEVIDPLVSMENIDDTEHME